MNMLRKAFRRIASKRGQSLVEYALILALIAVVCILVLQGIGTHVNNTREVGRVRIAGSENKGKGNKRLEIVLEPT